MDRSLSFRRAASAAALAATIACSSAGAARAATWGVIIGVSKYQSAQIASLNFPAADARTLQEYLVQKGNVPEANIKLLVNDDATGEHIKAAFSDFLAKNVKPGDDVIVSMAGHGVSKGCGLDSKSYFLPTDVRGLSVAAMEQSAIDVRDISSQLAKLPAKQFIILVDACREDPTPGRGLKGNQLTDRLSSDFQVVPRDGPKSAASATFFACQIGERAYEDPNLQHGVFTYFVLDAIDKAVKLGERLGELQMDVLAGYVSDNVKQWAKQKNGEGSEIEQEPQLQALGETPKVVMLKVKPSDYLLPFSGRAVVYGAALKALDPPPPAGPGVDYFQRAEEAEREGRFEVAQQGYAVVIEQDPKFGPAYDRLARLYTIGGQNFRAIETLIKRNGNIPPDAHAYSELALCYTAIARKMAMAEQPGGAAKPEKHNDGGIRLPGGIRIGGGRKKKPEDTPAPDNAAAGAEAGDFRPTESAREAAAFALKAAKLAQSADDKSSEAKQAMGFALIATDSKGSNREAAIEIFGRAVFLDEKSAAATYGLGYALRYYSVFEKGDGQPAMLKRAVDALKRAIDLDPNYYEAHRELAYCYHQMNDTQNATKQYEIANANRGSASDPNEVAGLNVSLSSLYHIQADQATGDRKAQLMSCSAGYIDDAKEISPDMKTVMQNLLYQGPGRVIRNGMDRVLYAPYDAANRAVDAIPSFGGHGVRDLIPGGFRLP